PRLLRLLRAGEERLRLLRDAPVLPHQTLALHHRAGFAADQGCGHQRGGRDRRPYVTHSSLLCVGSSGGGARREEEEEVARADVADSMVNSPREASSVSGRANRAARGLLTYRTRSLARRLSLDARPGPGRAATAWMCLARSRFRSAAL